MQVKSCLALHMLPTVEENKTSSFSEQLMSLMQKKSRLALHMIPSTRENKISSITE